MDFARSLRFVQKEVNKSLKKFFTQKRKEAEALDPHAVTIVDTVSEFTLRGGKRIRPFLVWLGGNENLKLMPAMIAVELFQTFALIHDDIIDNDTKRRGGPTVHTTLGVNLAILAGDLALSWADELMEQTQNSKAIAMYERMKEETILGQALDVMHIDDKQKIDELKTAYYTVIRPLQIGAILGGKSQNSLIWMEKYGLVVGRAFQLRDDFLDNEITSVAFEKETKEILLKIPNVPNNPNLFNDFVRFVLTREA